MDEQHNLLNYIALNTETFREKVNIRTQQHRVVLCIKPRGADLHVFKLQSVYQLPVVVLLGTLTLNQRIGTIFNTVSVRLYTQDLCNICSIGTMMFKTEFVLYELLSCILEFHSRRFIN